MPDHDTEFLHLCYNNFMEQDILKQFSKLEKVSPMDEAVYEKILKNWDSVAKPLRGLGRFEELIAKTGAVLGTDDFDIGKRAVLVMCADNGIVEEGVSQSGQDVTAAVAGWMGRGESSVCKMAAAAKADVIPVDIGINMEGSPQGVLNRKIRRGTANFLKEPAMTGKELERAIETGIELVRDCKDKGYSMIATGEMGIGNTTTSSAVCAALLNLPPDKVTGRGAGLDDAGLSRKIEVIRRALDFHGCVNSADVILQEIKTAKTDKGGEETGNRDYVKRILAAVGGLDIAGLTGVFIGGAVYNIPIVIDGFISAVAGLAAESLLPGTKDVMIPSHLGREDGMKYVLKELDIEPVIDGDMALGEGTGAVMIFPLLDTALALYREGLRFGETEVAPYLKWL